MADSATMDEREGQARRALDFLLGRNLTIGVASMLLLFISGFATFRGMTDFIVGIQEAPSAAAEAEAGLSFGADVLVLAIVAALTFLMWIALRETVRPQRYWQLAFTLPLYLFLALWSVGFGYGYWWSLIAGSEATREGLAAQQEDLFAAGDSVRSRLDAVQVQLNSVVRLSEERMATEEASGGSCGVGSGAGRGPLWRARRDVRDTVDALKTDIEEGWLGPVQTELESFRAARAEGGAEIAAGTVAERQREFEAVAAENRRRARAIAGRSDALGAAFASEMRGLADRLSIAPRQSGFSCYDPALASRLRTAADAAAQPADLSLSEARFTEGPAGVANAVQSLWTKVGASIGALFGFGGGAESETLEGRDLIALLAAIGVDLGIFVLAVLNPPALASARRDAFSRNVSSVLLPNRTTVADLAKSLNAAIHDVPGMSLELVRMHFITHGGHAYMVIPNLYRCEEEDAAEIRRGIALNQVAGVLDEYRVVRPMWSWTRRSLWRSDPRRISDKVVKQSPEEFEGLTEDLKEDVRNAWREGQGAGLFAKGRRLLKAAGWSQDACTNPEVWPLTSAAGLTPLLMVLEEAAKLQGEAPLETFGAGAVAEGGRSDAETAEAAKGAAS